MFIARTSAACDYGDGGYIAQSHWLEFPDTNRVQ
jgi:hypothetical protein